MTLRSYLIFISKQKLRYLAVVTINIIEERRMAIINIVYESKKLIEFNIFDMGNDIQSFDPKIEPGFHETIITKNNSYYHTLPGPEFYILGSFLMNQFTDKGPFYIFYKQFVLKQHEYFAE